jgi:hypothetical protein
MTLSFKSSNEINAPVLFLVYNRPDTTKKVFKAIKEAKPKKLYVAADGPKLSEHHYIEKVTQVRKIATSVDWPCKVKILFRKENLGIIKSITESINWFFKYEPEGIILEDDCVPHPHFFIFCEKLLHYYRNNSKIFAISGSNIINKKENESYHFSKYFHPWGWASWRRAWDYYDNKISFWPKWKDSADCNNKMPNKSERIIFKKIFLMEHTNKRNNWDYRFMASILKNRGLILRSNINLINNIGFGKNATHTIKKKIHDTYPKPVKSIHYKLIHPAKIVQDKLKDLNLFTKIFDDKNLRMPFLLLNMPTRVINYILRKIK